MLGGLITCLLLVIYCRKHFNEKVSALNIRMIRSKMQNESMAELNIGENGFRMTPSVKPHAKN
ncbi:hypothetical protein GCAAIG_11035 [Candidatus Electronema halotolerans]